jgi:Sigma-70, region 4
VKIESQQPPQPQQQIEWRRSKVLELDSQGHSQPEIARILQVSVGTVNRDLMYIREQSKQKIRKYIDETLPEEYEKCLVGITSILKEAWNTSQQAENKKEKIHALSLAKECYSMKLELLTNATVVNDAMKFVSDESKENLKKLPKKLPNKEERDSNEQQSKEEQPDYDEDKDQLEEEQEEETGEISTETINQVF